MKQFRLLLTILTLLTVGGMNTWAETCTISGTTSGSVNNVLSWNTTKGNSSNAPIWSSDHYRFYYASSGNGGCMTITPQTGITITGITLKATGRNYTPTVKYNIDGGSDITGKWNSTTMSITGISAKNSFKFRNANESTNKQLRVSITITYEIASSCNKPTFTIADKTISLSEAQTGYDMSTNLTIGKGGSMGAITYSCDNSDVNIMGDKFNTSVAGTYTINATMAAYATYCEATTTFTITVQSAPCTQLEKPTGLSTTNVTATSAELSWTAVSNATKYLVTYSDANLGSKQENATATTYTLTNLTPSTQYSWAVKAIGDGTTYCDSEDSQTTGGFTTAALPEYTITWSANGTTHTTTQVTPGDKIVLPTTDPTSCSSTYTNFVGWFTEAAGSESNPSTAKPATQVTAATIPTGAATYYAVFSDATELETTLNIPNNTLIGSLNASYSDKSFSVNGYSFNLNACKQNDYCQMRDNNTISYIEIPTLSGRITKISTSDCKNGSGSAYNGTLHLKTTKTRGNSDKDDIAKVTYSSVSSFSWDLSTTNATSGFLVTSAGLRLKDLSITYLATTPATGYISSCCNDPAVVTVTPATTTINLGEDGKATTTVACTQQNGVTAGKWSYSVSPSTATFDGTNFVAAAAGEYTLTATYTENCGKSGMATITVTNTPVLYFPTTPADPIVFGTVECGGNTPLENKQSISLRGYNLTSDVTVTVTGDYKIAGTESAELADYTTSLILPKDAVSGLSTSVYVVSTPPIQSSSPTTGKVIFTTTGGNTLEVNLSTPDITCTEYTLKLNDRGTTTLAGNYLAGAIVPQPADPTGVCTEPINYIFDGWATAKVAEGSTTYTKVSFPYTMLKANTTLYAVYKYSPTISNDYQKITAKESLTDGEYLIVGSSSSTYKALSSIEGSTDGQYKAVAVTPTSNVITTDDETLIWNVSVENGKYTIAQGGQYLNINNSVMVLESTAIPYTLTVSSGVFTFTTTDSKSSSTTKISYYANHSVFNAFSKANTVYLYRRQQDTYYTTSPVCGPYVRITSGKELYVTAGNAGGTRSSVQVQDTVKFKAGNLQGNNGNQPKIKIPAADIICNGAATDKVKAVISQTVTGNGDGTYSISGTIVLTYKPVAFDVREDITLQLRAEYNTGNDVMLDAVTLHARSLPEKFVIVAKNTDWYALNADMSGSSSQPANSHVTVDETAATAVAPCNTLYTFDGMPKGGDLRYVRFVGVAGKYLWAASADNVGIQNYAGNTPAAANDSYNWLLTTSDNVTYTFSNPQNDKMLRLNDSKFAMYVSGVQEFRILPVTDTCVFNYAPANFRKETVKSTSATLAWDAVAGATMYQLSTDGITWTDVAATSYTLTGLKAATPYTCYLRARHGDGTDICSEVTSLLFTTTDCDDVPYDLAYTSDLSSVTITWNCETASAKIVLYSAPECTDGDIVGTQTVNAKTCTFTGLPANVVRYVKVFADGTCASEVLEVKTESPVLDVVEWDVDKINVSLNTEEKVSVVLENEVTKHTGQDALDIFFSKYFEAAGSVKLLAIYNGTKHSIDLSNVRIEGMAVTTTEQVWSADEYDRIDLSPIGSIAPDEEIVLYSLLTHHTVDYDNATDASGNSTNPDKQRSITIAKCIQSKQGWAQAGWYPVGDNTIRVLQDAGYTGAVNKFGNSEIATGGDKVFRLIRTENGVDADIDIIGAAKTNDNGERTIIQTADMSKPTNGDKVGWTCNDGVEYEGNPNTAYQLSTNRHLLIRKKVDSGADAVALNTDGFHTLCTEWEGRIVPSYKDKETENDITCSEFDNVLGFNYNEYYTEYETFMEEKEFEESSRNSDGTITIDMPADNTLDKIPCQKLKIIVKNSNNEEIIANEYKVPIIVNQNTNTENTAFFGGKLTEEICKTCDVVVRDNATLSVVDGGKNTVRDIMVYQGSVLSVPQGKEYTANSLSLRRREQAAGDEVASLDYQGTLNLTHSSEKSVYLDLLISANNWHFFSLPYDCNIADVVYSNGKPAVYGTDWFLMYYDGARRASSQQTGSNWRKYEGATIEAGKGYVVGIKGSPDNAGYIYELRFPMAKEVLTTESTNKSVPVNAYGAGTDIRPNHKGWNLVGNPYLNHYKKEGTADFQGLVSGLLDYDPVTGYWSLDTEGERNHPYITIPQNFGWTAYNQVLVSQTPLSPFTCYFLQITGDTDGEARAIDFSAGQRGRAAMPMLSPQIVDEPVIVDVALRNAAGEQDHTALVIDDRFTDDYEMDADFFKWFGDYYRRYTQPVVYSLGADGGKRAFNAISEASALQPVSLGYFASHAGEYTFSLNRTSDLARVAEIWLFDAQTGAYTNLLQQDYTFSTSPADGAGRFTLNARLLPKVITGVDNLGADNLRISSSHRVITVSGLPSSASLWLYDAAGKLVSAERTCTWQRTFTVPQSGTYFLRVETPQGANTLSTVVE